MRVDGTALRLCQQCMRAPIIPHPHQHWVLSVFRVLAVLVGVW